MGNITFPCQRWKRELMRSIKLLSQEKWKQMGNDTRVGKPQRDLGLCFWPRHKARAALWDP